jgi:type II secretory pathway pseudopilin PulG
MLPNTSPLSSRDHGRSARQKIPQTALTLVEVMVSLTLMATVMAGFMGTFVQSRRVTEGAVLHAAATSMVYGVIEQIKQLDYGSLLPNYEQDPEETTSKTPPYIRVRINQGTPIWLMVRHTTAGSTPKAPTTTPAASAVAADVGLSPGAIDNSMGNIPLSTVTGTTSQQINLNFWVWIDEITNTGTWSAEGTAPVSDASEVKKVTVIYTYQYQDGGKTRTVRDREVFLRTRYDQ